MATTIDKVKHINLGTSGVTKRITSAANHSDKTSTSITLRHTLIAANVGYYMNWNRKTLFGENGYLKKITFRYKFQPSTGSGHETGIAYGAPESDGDIKFTKLDKKTNLGTSVNIIEFPNVDGSSFGLYTDSNGNEVYYVGFYGEKSSVSTFYWYITEIDFEATYTVPAYTITIKSNNTDYGTVSAVDSGNNVFTNQKDIEAGTTVTLTATPNEHYKFVKWSDGNTSATRTVTANSDITYTATFEPDKINKIYIGTSKPKEIYVGTTPVKAIYVGTTKVYG